jgi:hypothetical protein
MQKIDAGVFDVSATLRIGHLSAKPSNLNKFAPDKGCAGNSGVRKNLNSFTRSYRSYAGSLGAEKTLRK